MKIQVYTQQCGSLAQGHSVEWKQWETDLQYNIISVNVKGIHKTLRVLNYQGYVSNKLQFVCRKRMRVENEKVKER